MAGDLLMMIEEQRAAIREAEREVAEALAQMAELEKKIAYLQWHVGQLKRLYALTSSLAQEETTHTRTRLAAVPQLPLMEKTGERNGRPGTIKQAIIDVLRENRRQMVARDIWDAMQKRGVTINSERPLEVVASTMRASITRGQNIFTKDGTKFGLVEWQTARGT